MNPNRLRMAAKLQSQRTLQAMERENRRAAAMRTLMTPVAVKTTVKVSANQPVFTLLRAVPKAPRERNQVLLDMARGKPCLLQSAICRPDPETTVACHGAGVANGKGMSYKTSDFLTCWGCAQCNHYTDAYGGATAEQKTAVFQAGFARQLLAWRGLAENPQGKPQHQRAAQWALDRWAASIARKEAKNV